MHPVFATAGDARRCRSGSSTPANFAEAIEELDARARAFAKAAGFEPKAGPASCCCRAATASSPACCSASRRRRRRSRTCSCPARCRRCCRAGTYRFANAPHDARLAALAFALGSYHFTRYRKAEARNDASSMLPRRRRRRRARAHRRRRDAGARSHQHAGERHGPGRARSRPRASSPRSTAPTINVIVGDDLLTKNFPLIHAVGRAARRARRG